MIRANSAIAAFVSIMSDAYNFTAALVCSFIYFIKQFFLVDFKITSYCINTNICRIHIFSTSRWEWIVLLKQNVMIDRWVMKFPIHLCSINTYKKKRLVKRNHPLFETLSDSYQTQFKDK